MLNERIIYTLDAFKLAMIDELEANTHKGDFALWTPDPMYLATEIGHHTDKMVNELIYTRNPDRVTEYAADIANYALKAFSLYPSPRYWDAVRGVPIRH